MDAQPGVRRCGDPLSEPGTAQQPSSAGLAAILSALTLISNQLDTVIEQQEDMIRLLEGEVDQEGDEVPQTDISGRPIQ